MLPKPINVRLSYFSFGKIRSRVSMATGTAQSNFTGVWESERDVCFLCLFVNAFVREDMAFHCSPKQMTTFSPFTVSPSFVLFLSFFLSGRRWIPWLQGRYGNQGWQGEEFIFCSSFFGQMPSTYLDVAEHNIQQSLSNYFHQSGRDLVFLWQAYDEGYSKTQSDFKKWWKR